ncbi:MAG TPA: hypothetical protein VFV68_10590, partial [Agriterribacter sp.]|nr:hypothetical protein [Agriterribacter sp.]
MRYFFFLLSFVFIHSSFTQITYSPASAKDNYFWQEFHKPFPVSKNPADNEVRSITADSGSDVWIATATGVFRKKKEGFAWEKINTGNDNGPAYAVISDSTSGIWTGTWNGVFHFQNNRLVKIEGTEGPVSVLCSSKEGIYAFGPKGVWLCKTNLFERKDYPIARSVRNAISDNHGGVWVTSDVGLYHCTPGSIKYFKETDILLSAYLKDLAVDTKNQLWIGGLGGVSVLLGDKKQQFLKPSDGIPSIYVNTVQRSPDNLMWVGTDVGIVRYSPDGSHSLRFGRRWLLD